MLVTQSEREEVDPQKRDESDEFTLRFESTNDERQVEEGDSDGDPERHRADDIPQAADGRIEPGDGLTRQASRPAIPQTPGAVRGCRRPLTVTVRREHSSEHDRDDGPCSEDVCSRQRMVRTTAEPRGVAAWSRGRLRQ